MKMSNSVQFILAVVMLVTVFTTSLPAEEFSILFSASVRGETEPCG